MGAASVTLKVDLAAIAAEHVRAIGVSLRCFGLLKLFWLSLLSIDSGL